ncbi:hypothetical protein SDC9_101555 [bioreactor metagenome]|uniref:Uncharacterized protein n=1 Tax=bioreactor metagenome TaxID=1076179 RepID=A0A645ANH1_9ZZZZ
MGAQLWTFTHLLENHGKLVEAFAFFGGEVSKSSAIGTRTEITHF